MNNLVTKLFCKENALSWRRVTISLGLEIFAGFALWYGKIDATTWAYFAGSIAGVYIGGDTGQKMLSSFSKPKKDDLNG